MAASQFDTLAFTKQLTKAGVAPDIAEVHAMTLQQALSANTGDLVTKEWLAHHLDARFSRIAATLRVQAWIQGILVAGVFLPHIAKLGA